MNNDDRGTVLDDGLATRWVAFPPRISILTKLSPLDREYEAAASRWYYICGPRNDSDYIADIRVPANENGARDAKIMVAAPQMLEALKTVAGWFQGFDMKEMNLDPSIKEVLRTVDDAIDAANAGRTPGKDIFGNSL